MILATALVANNHVASVGAAVLEVHREVRLHGGRGGDHLADLRIHDLRRHLSGIDVTLGGNPVSDKIGRARPQDGTRGMPPNTVEKGLIPL